MEADQLGRLHDILEAARLIGSYVKDTTETGFRTDTQKQDAVIRRLEIIGEAGRRVSDGTRALYPQVPWHAIIGMRNVIIHQYDAVDLTIVWDAVQTDLPRLIATLTLKAPPDPIA